MPCEYGEICSPVEPRLALANEHEAVGKLAVVLAQRAHLGARERDARLKRFNYFVIVESLAVFRDLLLFARHAPPLIRASRRRKTRQLAPLYRSIRSWSVMQIKETAPTPATTRTNRRHRATRAEIPPAPTTWSASSLFVCCKRTMRSSIVFFATTFSTLTTRVCPNAVRAVGRLALRRGVPPWVGMNHDRRARKVQTRAARLQRNEKRRGVVFIERIDEPHAFFLRRSTRDGIMCDARLAQPFGNQLKETRELREHERLFPALHGGRNQIDNRVELGGRPR